MLGQQISIRKTSAWTFNTSGTGGLGLGLFTATGGELVLNPPSGDPKGFYYGAVGAGLSLGVRKIPKIGRILDSRGLSERGGANVAPKSFWNHGVVYVMDGCRGDELTAEDFRGICIATDVGGGVLVGYAGTALLINVDPLALMAQTNPALSLIGPPLRPKAMVLSRGWNVGPQASVGISETVGFMWPKKGAA